MRTVSPDPALGAVLLEQKIKAGTVGNALFLLVLGILAMLVVGAPTAPIGVKVSFFLFGAGVAGLALWMLWRHWMHVFLQERGIREYRQRRGRSLPYNQADEITYSSLRVFMNGSYIHTVEKVALKSDREAGPPLVCTHIFKEADGRAPGEAERRFSTCAMQSACGWPSGCRNRLPAKPQSNGHRNCASAHMAWSLSTRAAAVNSSHGAA